MRHRFLLAVVVGSLLVPCVMSAQAPAGATGKCKDGTFTTAATKQGACRGHQGIDTWFAAGQAKGAAKEAAPAKAPKSAAAPAAAATSAPASGSAPAGATGKCKDGTFTTAATKQGACRGHQGIDAWYAAQPAAAATPAASAPVPVPKTAASNAVPASGAAPAGATGKCKDGTFTSAATKQGACRGHQGIDTWFAATASAPAPSATAPVAAPTPVAAPAPASTPARASTSDKAAAPGGGPGLVWVNTESNVYHCYGTHWYGITKAGKYMSEAQATGAGARPDHGSPCSK